MYLHMRLLVRLPAKYFFAFLFLFSATAFSCHPATHSRGEKGAEEGWRQSRSPGTCTTKWGEEEEEEQEEEKKGKGGNEYGSGCGKN